MMTTGAQVFGQKRVAIEMDGGAKDVEMSLDLARIAQREDLTARRAGKFELHRLHMAGCRQQGLGAEARARQSLGAGDRRLELSERFVVGGEFGANRQGDPVGVGPEDHGP